VYVEEFAEKEIRCVDCDDGRGSTVRGLCGKLVVMVNNESLVHKGSAISPKYS